MSGTWCECAEKLLPVGAFAVYQDGVTHSPEGCEVDTW